MSMQIKKEIITRFLKKGLWFEADVARMELKVSEKTFKAIEVLVEAEKIIIEGQRKFQLIQAVNKCFVEA